MQIPEFCPMKILLCAATEMEIAASIQQLSLHKNTAIEIVITGVGLMTSTYGLAKAVAIHHPGLLVQAGIAGSLDKALELGKVVAVQSETVGDLGVQETEQFRSLFDLKLLSADMPPWKAGKLINDNEILSACNLPVVDAVTVNEISTDEKRIAHYREAFKAGIETMEGAALHYVGLMEKIPFLQIRSVSNFIGERDKTKWAMQKAISNLNRDLQRILKTLTE